MPEELESMMWHEQFEQCKTNVDDSYEGDHQDVAHDPSGLK